MEIEVGCVVAYATGKSGVVRFVGETDFAAGEWVGLELERPDGKNNGELNGRVYFTCAPNHGLFCKRAQIKAVLSRPHRAGAATSSSPAASSRLSMSAASASRLQQMRDRRASTVGSAGSHLRAPSSGPSALTRPSSGSFSRSSSSVTTPPSSAIKRPGSASRASLDMGTRRPSLSRASSVSGLSASDEQLADARAKIAKLEQELEQKNRNVEQLKQSLAVVREAAAAAREAKAEEEAAATAAAAAAAQDASAATDETDDAMVDDAPAQDKDAGDDDEPMDVDAASAQEDAAAAKEAELLATIESVKHEADELVRNVRAEYEEHIAALMREHETQSDDLRLENATQASEIKALESDLAQQKLRIAQFSAAEQKKADEVAHALAKQSTGARKVEALEAQITELHDMIESLTLEKESLEMDKEIAEENAEECLAEVEKLKAALALATAAAATAPEPSAVAATAVTHAATEELTEENRKLRAAVKALHERASEEKTELNKKLRVAQREHTELLGLREEVEQLTTKRTELEAEVEELKEQLDLASAYESLIEELTEKNLTLDETNAELRQELRELEEMKEVHEDMEHHHAEYEEELRAEIDAKHASLQDLKQRLAELKTVIDDKDRTIDRFRDLTQTHRDEIHQLKAQLRAETGELETLKGTAHSALNQTLSLRALAAAAREHEAEAAKQRIHAEQASVENAFFRALIPSSILSDLDQKMLRVRLRLGRVAGKADILIQYVRKDLDAVLQASPVAVDATKDASATAPTTLLDSARSIQQLLLGEKLAAVACQAQEDLFLLECHLTTEDEFAHACALLDTPAVGALEAALDTGVAAFADGSLLAARSAGDATTYDRLVATLDEWCASRAATASAAADGFPLRCAVVKLQARKSVLSLACSLAVVLTFARSVRLFVASPENAARDDLQAELVPVVDELIRGLSALVATALHFYRRAEIDLAPSDEDLDGVVATGGDVVELVHAYARESQQLWVLVDDQLAFSRLQDAPVAALVAGATDALVPLVAALNDKVASLFKAVCRGAFTDAVAPRARDRSRPDAPDGRPQWRMRAQAIHSELLHASTLRGSLTELSDVCQALQARMRELERADSQHRVVTQKLESEVLRLTDVVAHAASETAALEAQLTLEREQFAATLDESHKERAALDALNRELRKQLKRSSDAGAAASSASSSRAKTASALSHGDAEAFRHALAHLHRELSRVRSVLATERLERALGPTPLAPPRAPSVRVQASLKRVATFAAHVKAQLAMPQLVDLAHAAPHAQLVTTALAQTKRRDALAALQADVSAAVRADGWSDDIVRAIERGESVFGWQPPEMERPAVLRSRVTLRTERPSAPALPVIPLLLTRSDVAQLSHALVC